MRGAARNGRVRPTDEPSTKEPSMAEVHVVATDEIEDGYRFDVTVEHAGRRTSHVVTLRGDDYERWAELGTSPAAVAHRCVELLLDRVPHSELMDRFDLRETINLYPAFESDIHRRFG